MFFCENDNNMLYIKIDDNDKLKYYCKLCMEEYDLDKLEGKNKQCVYKQNYNVNSYSYKTYVNDNIYEDPTIPTITNIKCVNVKCPSNEGTPKKIKYIKYNRDEMKFIYCCCVCKAKWTSSNEKLE